MKKIKHYGWKVSPYSAKTRAYLRYAGVEFDDVAPSMATLLLKVKPAVGEVVMPTVCLADGHFIKDSSNIIDHFAKQGRASSITPKGPKQSIASAVLEVYADEWLPVMALHFRWNREENANFAIKEFGKNAMPWLPGILQKFIGQKMAAKMQGYMPKFGINPQTQPAIERMTEHLLDDMDEVLAEQTYLLGECPCMGDFALYGQLYAHLYRDPDTTKLFYSRKHLLRWIGQMESPIAKGDFLESDKLAPGVERILKRAFAEQWAYLQKLVTLIDEYVKNNPEATRVPRALGQLDVIIGGVNTQRKAITFAQWKMQRACASYASLNATAKQEADAWLAKLGGNALKQPPSHPFVFVGKQLALLK